MGARTDDSVAGRLAVAAGSGRWQNWSVALDQWQTAPATGTGAGDYRFEWNERRDLPLDVVNAHSLYLEVAGESGLVGLLLLEEIPRIVFSFAVGQSFSSHPLGPLYNLLVIVFNRPPHHTIKYSVFQI